MEQKHVFVVEDDYEIRLNVISILEKKGYRVTDVNNGLDAFNRINYLRNQKENIDLIITDINLPGITGIELIKRLEKIKLSCPTLVMTAFGNKDMLVELLRMGCEDYIDKPFSINNFSESVERIITNNDEKERNQNIEKRKLEKEKDRANTKLKQYKCEYEELRSQVSSAVNVYRDLINNIQKGSFNVNVAFRYLPYKEIGGDLVEIQNTEKGCNIIVADVSGHDISASYHVILVKSFFDKYNSQDGTLFFKELNKELYKNGTNNRLVTASLVNIDFKTMTGNVVSAAHPGPIKQSAYHLNPLTLSASGDVLGIHDDVSFNTRSFKVRSGDCLFLYTDGVTNIYRSNGSPNKKEKLTGAGLDDLIMKHCKRPLKDKVDNIWKEALEFCDYKANDDMLLLGVEIP